MCIYKAHTATMFDMYCGSQFSYIAHLITVTDRSPYSECRFHSNIKALLEKWSQNTVKIFFCCITNDQGRGGVHLLMVSNSYMGHQIYSVAHVLFMHFVLFVMVKHVIACF